MLVVKCRWDAQNGAISPMEKKPLFGLRNLEVSGIVPHPREPKKSKRRAMAASFLAAAGTGGGYGNGRWRQTKNGALLYGSLRVRIRANIHIKVRLR